MPSHTSELHQWESAYCLAVSLTILVSLVQTDFTVQTGLAILIVGLFPIGIAVLLVNRRWPPALAVLACVLLTGIIGLLLAIVSIFEAQWS